MHRALDRARRVPGRRIELAFERGPQRLGERAGLRRRPSPPFDDDPLDVQVERSHGVTVSAPSFTTVIPLIWICGAKIWMPSGLIVM